MPERAELIIASDTSKTITDLAAVDAAEKKLERGFENLKVSVAGSELELSRLGQIARGQVLSALQAVEQQATKTSQALSRIAPDKAIDPTRIIPGARGGAFGNVGAAIGGQTEGAALAKFNAAARALNERTLNDDNLRIIRNTLKETEQASAGASRGFLATGSAAERAAIGTGRLQHVAAELKNTLKQEIGFRSVLADVLDVGGALAGGGPIVLGIGAVILALKSLSDEATKADERLKLLQAQVNRGLVGGVGGRKQVLDDLRSAIKEITESQGLPGFDQFKFIQDRFKGEFTTAEEIQQRVRAIETLTRQLEGRKFQRGEENIFDTASKSLRQLASDAGALDATAEKLRGLREAFLAGKLDDEGFAKGVEKIKTALEQEVSIRQQVDQARSESAQRAKEEIALQRELRSSFEALNARLSGDNPFARIFDESSQRVRAFKEQFVDAGKGITDAFIKANEQLKNLDIFKAELAGEGRIADLLLRGEQIRAQRTESLAADRAAKDAIVKEIETRRSEGTLTSREQFDLLAKERAIGQRSTVDQRAIELAEKAIRDSQTKLAQFDPSSAAGRSALAAQLDFALGAIGRVSPEKLTADLFDTQLRLIEQRAQLELQLKEDAVKQQASQAEQTKQLLEAARTVINAQTTITILDPQRATTIQRLGPAPGAE